MNNNEIKVLGATAKNLNSLKLASTIPGVGTTGQSFTFNHINAPFEDDFYIDPLKRGKPGILAYNEDGDLIKCSIPSAYIDGEFANAYKYLVPVYKTNSKYPIDWYEIKQCDENPPPTEDLPENNTNA